MHLDRYDNSSFDRGASRLHEALWILCKCLFFLGPLPWPSRLRVALLRLFGAKMGANNVIRSGVNISFPWRFTSGDHVWIGEDVSILSLATVSLGSNVCLSQKAYLCTGSHDWKKDTFDLITSPIVVEDECWVAAMSFLAAGVTVGRGSVVSAGAVVRKSIPAEHMAMGNPATVQPKKR